jgi:hypothetical protein
VSHHHPKWLVPIFDWGCTIWSMIDCREPAGPMWYSHDGDMEPQGMTLSDWLARWLHGELDPEGPDTGSIA